MPASRFTPEERLGYARLACIRTVASVAKMLGVAWPTVQSWRRAAGLTSGVAKRRPPTAQPRLDRNEPELRRMINRAQALVDERRFLLRR